MAWQVYQNYIYKCRIYCVKGCYSFVGYKWVSFLLSRRLAWWFHWLFLLLGNSHLGRFWDIRFSFPHGTRRIPSKDPWRGTRFPSRRRLGWRLDSRTGRKWTRGSWTKCFSHLALWRCTCCMFEHTHAPTRRMSTYFLNSTRTQIKITQRNKKKKEKRTQEHKGIMGNASEIR